MSEIKSHEFDGAIGRIMKAYRIVVFYGPDRGLVSERAQLIAKQSGIPLDDPFAVTRLDSTSLQADPGRLIDEAQSLGLFGGEKLVWLRVAGTEKPLNDSVELLAKTGLEGCLLIIEAGDLKKGSAFRKTCEASRAVAITACYPDDARAINAMVDSELSHTGQRLTPAAREHLVSALGGDRIASRNEIQKLLLYCMGLDQIDLEHVTDIIGDASGTSVDDAVDAILKGDRDGFLHAAQKVISSKTPVFLLLQACLRQFQQLDAMRTEMDDKKVQAPQIMQTLGRGVHFRRKPVVERALRAWTQSDLSRESARLNAAILQTRQRPALESEIALTTLLSTTLQAARRNA